ncbi:hypothetical protein BWQ96_02598 [Gracilariopsis chorda]|uniref:Uncharacterized protein n=1 Tax=Gracilariopsis chorda TaxID=448386 RepID=A0A2V3IZU6_9FLOR|nr:hypothetical protein BWQ96_02598 [Gracilariopsis chorda]|eukprot:PXF47619.1 hypothetical protein BWQ96_02598 [Gracilariopsis chorda]
MHTPTPTLLVVRLNGMATGYDLASPERRRYDLNSQDDWHEFRMLSFNRRLQRLSLSSSKRSTSPPAPALRTKGAIRKRKRTKTKRVTARLQT